MTNENTAPGPSGDEVAEEMPPSKEGTNEGSGESNDQDASSEELDSESEN